MPVVSDIPYFGKCFLDGQQRLWHDSRLTSFKKRSEKKSRIISVIS